ncbi:hypothetical protein MUK42_34900 [Musa troglodytarum]|uniref:Uncharacterized protein n=1 Tax=Musa troglodytarum TaxID=320322 RepID=A0A9E7JZ08_9LILI|nr:hypothetical protein MUK42_34900 [Musa troglodytarum]
MFAHNDIKRRALASLNPMASRTLVEAVAPSPTAGSHGESALAHVVQAREDPILGVRELSHPLPFILRVALLLLSLEHFSLHRFAYDEHCIELPQGRDIHEKTWAPDAIVLQTQKLVRSQQQTGEDIGDSLGERHGDHCADAAGMISCIPVWLWMRTSRKKPARLVMALERARAEETPIPPPDMSSPRSSFANLSFINSISDKRHHKDCDLMVSKVVLFTYFFEHIHYVCNSRFNSCSNATVVPEGCSLTPASLLNRDLGACSGGWPVALDPWLLKSILSSSSGPLSKVWLSSLLPELSDIPLPRTNRSRL